ncbi:MAG: adenosylcobinamide-GDP ribazoletransferase [Christensenellaceae bacterium]|nr:adenosylcobinamide-GDP ribazoletransferase [Christensenellaceae bacterium]
MKKLIYAFFMALGMFTAIPCPYRPWDEDARPLMILCLPVIGLLIGAIWMGIGMLGRYLGLPILIMAAIMVILPHLLTGFIHLDGYMDVSDAVLSRRSAEERRRILKDPHVGSFAVIMVCALFLMSYGVFASASDKTDLKILLFVPAVVRACAGLAIAVLKPLETSQYSGSYREKVKTANMIVPCVFLAIFAAGSYLFCDAAGVISCVAAVVGYWLSVLWGYRDLSGMSGDISGFGLVVGELCGVAAMVLTGGLL